MELFKNTNFDFLGRKWPFIIASLILTAAGLVSLAIHGGPRYGIDFRGGALVYVKFANTPSPDKVRAALASKIPGGGAPEVVEVKGTNELIIGTEIQDEKTLAVTRQVIVDTLAKEFGQSSGNKVDINNTGSVDAIVNRLREPLQRNGVNLSEQQLQDLVKAIVRFRDTPPRSGLIRAIRGARSGTGRREDRRRPAAASHLRCAFGSGRNAGLHCLPL
jgi:preprotein translocase subunit SecF